MPVTKARTGKKGLLERGLEENTFFTSIEDIQSKEDVTQEEAINRLRRIALNNTEHPLYEMFGKVARREITLDTVVRYFNNHKKRWKEGIEETSRVLREKDAIQNPLPEDTETRSILTLRIFKDGEIKEVTLKELMNGMVIGDAYIHAV